MLYICTYRPSPKPLLPVAVQGYDVERHRGDMHGESLGIGQKEAQRASQLPLALQGVDQGEGQAQGVDQQVSCGHTREVSHIMKRKRNGTKSNVEKTSTPPAWFCQSVLPQRALL